jgi:flavin reductase (DIM6/NTAB) family NADH-FMN oxidoreductase RutF
VADDPTRATFDALVAAMDPAMIVVTAASGEERDGCLVGFHSQSSIQPPRYTVWLSVENRTYRLAQSATHLAVHALSASHHAVAEHFGGMTGDDVDKLAGVEWTEGPGGVPLLDAVPTRVVGRIVDRLTAGGGDHVAFVLEPLRADGELEHPFRLSDASDIDPGHPA